MYFSFPNCTVVSRKMDKIYIKTLRELDIISISVFRACHPYIFHEVKSAALLKGLK